MKLIFKSKKKEGDFIRTLVKMEKISYILQWEIFQYGKQDYR